MSSLKKIKELLKFSKKKTYKINMYAEAVLDDARVIATDSESFEIGAEVYVINDEGAVESLSEGIYKMQDGSEIRIDADSKVAGIGDEEEVVEEEEVIEEELAEHEEDEMSKKFYDKFEEVASEELAKKMIDFIKEEMAKHKEEMSEEIEEEKVEETKEEEVELEKTEMSSDLIGEMLTRLNAIESKMTALSEEPASEGLSVTPKVDANEVNLSKLSVKDRVAYYVNKN